MPDVKPGWKTTEFWLALLATLMPTILAVLQGLQAGTEKGSIQSYILLALIGAISSFGYSHSRSVVKGAAANAAKVLAVLCCLLSGSAMAADDIKDEPFPNLGTPSLAAPKDAAKATTKPDAKSIVKAEQKPAQAKQATTDAPTDRCKCVDCTCDPCVCGYTANATSGHYETVRECLGDRCTLKKVWVAAPPEPIQVTESARFTYTESRNFRSRSREGLFRRRR